MTHPSSLTTSLSTLACLVDERVAEDRERHARRQRATKIAELVAYRHRRRAEQAQQQRRQQQRRERARQRLEEAARRRGIEHAQAVRVRIATDHEAHLAELRLAHEIELTQARGDRARASLRHWLMLASIACLLSTSGLALALLDSARPDLGQAQRVLPSAPALLLVASTLPDASGTPADVTPAPEPPRARPATPSPLRATPVSRPRDLPAPTRSSSSACDDTSGDPCCAFGVIMC